MSLRETLLFLLFCSTVNLPAIWCGQLRYALFTAENNPGLLSAAKLAEEMINNDTSVLTGYNLTLTGVYNTNCDRATTFSQYFSLISPTNPPVLGILGCGCSPATASLAEIIHYNSISQISYTASSMELTNTTSMFPNLINMYPPSSVFASAITTMVQFYGWKQMTIITESVELFSTITESIYQLVMPLALKVVNKMAPNANPITDQIFASFISEDNRIYFINTYANIARQIICKAHLQGYNFPNYIWLTHSWYRPNWWTTEAHEEEPIGCSDDQIMQALRGSLAIDLFPSLDDPKSTIDTTPTPRQFEEFFQQRLNNSRTKGNSWFESAIVFDAVWTLALALNKTSDMIETSETLNVTQCEGSTPEELTSLKNFTYYSPMWGCIMRWNLKQTRFIGVSGIVEFDNFGYRMNKNVGFLQYRSTVTSSSLSLVKFAKAERNDENHTVSIFLYLSGESNLSIFPSGLIPFDGTPVTVITTYQLPLVIMYYIIAAIGIIFTTLCLIFNFTQRNKRIVRLTSPNINYFIILCNYLINICVVFRLVPGTSFIANSASCIGYSVVSKIGYSLGFGAIVVKMGRIYYICNNPTASKKKLSDWKITIIVLIFSGISVFLVLMQVLVPQFRPEPVLYPNKEYSTDDRNEFGIRIRYMFYSCNSTKNIPQIIWLIIIYVYQIILLLIGIYFTVKIKKVRIKSLNDYKYAAAKMYFVSIAVVLLIILTLSLNGYPNIGEGIIAAATLLAGDMFLAMAFVPKMVSLYRDPNGDHVLDMMDTYPDTTTTLDKAQEDTIIQLQSKIVDLEGKLINYKEFCSCHQSESPQAQDS